MDLNTSAEVQSGQQEQHQATDSQSAANQQQQSQQQQQPPINQQPNYTIPGILHYLQYEWHRFEVERQEWEVEKAELSARIALLQGEKKRHENLRHDLIRRIKMLEYCLRMERAKYHKLKHGTEPPPLEIPSSESIGDQSSEVTAQKSQNDDDYNNTNNSTTIAYGRELLKHYLQEIGYTDTIIDLRSNRVRSLLGIVDPTQNDVNQQENTNEKSQSNSNQTNHSKGATDIAPNNVDNRSSDSDELKANKPSSSTDRAVTDITKKSPFTSKLSNNVGTKLAGGMGDAESSVLANFEFLYDNEAMKDLGNLDEEEDETPDESIIDAADRAASTATSEYAYFDKECDEATAMIRQKLVLINNSQTPMIGDHNQTKTQRDGNRRAVGSDTTSATLNAATSTDSKNWCPSAPKGEVVDIGELATLTTLGSDTTPDEGSKRQWMNKYRLQSHYDCVRALRFSEKDSLIVTASEDETIKLWHLSRPASATSKSRQPSLPPSINAISTLEGSTLDIEPLYTYRGHTSRILSITTHRDFIFSGAQNGELIMWKIIQDPTTADQYDKYDSSLLVCRFEGHKDVIWSLEVAEFRTEQTNGEPLLCSVSADMTMKIWNISGRDTNPLKTIALESSPTCIAKMPLYNVSHGFDIAVSSVDGKIRLFDLSTSLNSLESNTQPTAILECDDSHRINSIVIHPTLPYLASADSNRSIKFWDLTTNNCKSTMVAHLDEVTCLACDPSGKYLLSASHDCSVRLWLFEEKSCIQEITSHRKKFDEGIFAVAFHPTLSQFATAGADGLAKVFV